MIKVKHNYISYFYYLTIFTLTFYGVRFWPFPMLYYIGMVIGVSVPIIITPSVFSTKQFVLWVLYFIVVFINLICGDSYFNKTKQLIDEMVALFIPIAIFYYYKTTHDFRWMRGVLLVTVVVLIWTTVVTAIFDSQIPGIVRSAQSMLQQGLEDASSFAIFYKVGMSNYILPHALPILLPAFAIALRDKSLSFKQRIVSFFVLACLLLLLYFGGASGPMLVGLLIVILSIFISPGNTKGLRGAIITVSIIALPLLLSDELMLGLLEWIDNLMGNEGHFHGKVLTFQETITSNSATGDVAERQELYSKGLTGFLDNILIGSNDDIGGHSVLLNRLGALGLVGFIPYVGILIAQLKMVIRQLPSGYRVYFHLGTFAALIMLLTKAISSWETYFFWFAVLPFAIIYFSKTNKSVR